MPSFNPEGRMFENSQRELPESQEALYDILIPENEKQRIELDEFSDLYGAETIAKDKAYVEGREQQFEKKDKADGSEKKYGELFEAIINYQIAKSDLMGPSASVIVPSRYDDIKNGIDTIVQFKGPKGSTSHTAFTIDVTGSEAEVTRKFERIRGDIKAGHLSVAKYFKTKNFRGELKPIARVIIGADRNTTKDISELILQFTRLQKMVAENRKNNNDSAVAQTTSKSIGEIRRKLADHPLHDVILSEIKIQLEAFQSYARALGNDTIFDEYGKILRIVMEIIDEKKSPDKTSNFLKEEDGMYRLIAQKASTFNQE